MLHQHKMRLMAASVLAGCLGLVGCGGEGTQAPAAKADKTDNVQTDAVEAEDNSVEETVVDDSASTPVDTAIDIASLTGDAVKGKRVFSKCMACHSMTAGQNRVGPSLFEIAGNPAGAVANFKYSPAMESAGVAWDDATLDGYLSNPKAFMPGNRMMFPGVPDAQDRADIIAYLKVSPE